MPRPPPPPVLKKAPNPITAVLLSLLVRGCLHAAPDSVVTFNEVNYHPQDPAAPEWVELHNQMSIRVDLGGWTLRGGIDYQFPENTFVEPGAEIVISSVAGSPAGALGPFTGRLDNKGEEIRLHGRWGRKMDEMTYADSDPWPAGADGGGFTLSKTHPDRLSADSSNWGDSTAAGGTPGTGNFPVIKEAPPRSAAAEGTFWKYEKGPAAGLEWTQLEGFDDSGWISGAAPLATSAPAATSLPAGNTPFRFRKIFGYTGGLENVQALVTGRLTGTAVFYLNGIEQGTSTGSGEFATTLPFGHIAVGADLLAVALTPAADGEAVMDLAITLIDGHTGVEPAPVPRQTGPVVINEISYHARPTYPDRANAISHAENPAEWIEFFNWTPAPADISGWKLRGGVDYDFPAGTVLAPGGFLVLDQSQFSGSLKNSGDTVRLRDRAGETVDELNYFDSGRWPAEADGGGSTLERRDPAADARSPENWAASDESAKTGWQTVTYRSTGAEPPGSNNPQVWHEFLFGMLDAGEVLIDDVSVIEDPDGVRLQLIQNGNFEADTVGGGAAHWRLLGTHKLSHVEADGAGKVLRLVATSEMEHTYNCASATLKSNRAVSNSKTYEISYRARWISGSPQLNSRLYLNRAARTTILAQPAISGTPGAPNTQRVANAGPAFQNLRHSPLVPDAGQPVRISAAAADPDGLASVRLWYSVSGGAWKSVPMGGGSEGTFFGVLPGQSQNVLVQFYIEAVDGQGAVSWFPKNGPGSRALYRVGDGGISTQTVRNKMRLLMTPADANQLHDPVHSVSNFRWPCTVIYNDQEVWYEAGVRLRSAPYGRQGNRAGWNIQFGSDAPFRGVQKSVVVDGAFNMPRTDGTGFQENSLGASVNEMLFQAIANRAGGIAASYDDIIYFQTPRTTEGNRRAQLKMTRFGSGFLEEFLPDGGEGMLYKQELIYYPNATVDGNPESLKRPYSAVLDTEIRSFGDSPDSYRFNYLHENHTDRDDYSGLMALGKAFDSSSATLAARTSAVMDLESWTRCYALVALTGLADTYNSGLAHNIELYVRPDNGKTMLFPWDQDHAFYYSPTSSVFGPGSHRLAAVLQIPANRRLYCAQLLDLCGTAFTNEYMDGVINHLGTVAAKPGYSATFRSYITNRRNYVMSQVRSLYPAVAFSITTGGGAAYSVSAPVAVIEGQGSIDVREIRVSRNGGAAVPGEVTWLDSKRWRLTVPVPPGANEIKFSALGATGAELASAVITVTNTGNVAPADSSNLMIAEINYHPVADGEEYLELLNTGTGTIDLAGLRFTAGIHFDFPATAVLLAAGQRLLVVRNRTAFEARYGNLLPVAGEFSALSQLSNSGDRLTLLDAGGAPIADFSYRDSLPWPEEADGAGYSLTRIIGSTGDPGDASLWRPSLLVGGTPGTSDHSPLSAYAGLLDYALISAPRPLPGLEDGQHRAVWSERLGADEAQVIPEVSRNLTTWQADPGDGSLLEILSTTSAGKVRTWTVRLGETVSFLRLRIVARQ